MKVGDPICGPARAVVIGLDGINGLQTARILVKRGIPVIGVARDPRSRCVLTRVCEEIIRADWRGAELIEALKELGPGWRKKRSFSPAMIPRSG